MTLNTRHEYPPEWDDDNAEKIIDWLKKHYPSYAALCEIEGEDKEIQAAIDSARERIE